MAEQSTLLNSEKSTLNRRDVLALAGAAVTMGAAQTMATPTYSALRVSDLVMLDAITLADAIRSRQVSCVEVMTAYLDHIEKLNPKVNALVALSVQITLNCHVYNWLTPMMRRRLGPLDDCHRCSLNRSRYFRYPPSGPIGDRPRSDFFNRIHSTSGCRGRAKCLWVPPRTPRRMRPLAPGHHPADARLAIYDGTTNKRQFGYTRSDP
jgi:hypothetical protein